MSLLSANIWLVAGGQVIGEQTCDVSRIQGARCSSFQGENHSQMHFFVSKLTCQQILKQFSSTKSFLTLQKNVLWLGVILWCFYTGVWHFKLHLKHFYILS